MKKGRAKVDKLAKRRKDANEVIPAKAGIQKYQSVTKHRTPASAGVTTSRKADKFGCGCKQILP